MTHAIPLAHAPDKDPMPMTSSNARARELLAEAGKALHGEHWMAPLARDLGILFDTVRKWANGKQERFDLTHPVWSEIEQLLADHSNRCKDAAAAIRKAVQE